MQLCLDLATKGLGSVSPNPLVGSVIVHEGEIIGSGYHEVYGGPHAEVNAIRSVKDPSLLKDSEVYVNLEPCSHFGKTPPCADLLISHQVKKVVIGMQDPNPLVSGTGIEKLRKAGIETELGVLAADCQRLNRRFIVNQTLRRPYVILKWAETLDRYIGGPVKQISGDAARKLLHKWRSEEDVFLVGTNTLLEDDPALSTRLVTGRHPIRAAIDIELKSENRNLRFYDGTQRSLIFNRHKDETVNGVEFIRIPSGSVRDILDALYRLKVGSIVVEGGSQLLSSFLQAGLYDELRIFQSKTILAKGGIRAPKVPQGGYEIENLGDDQLFIYPWHI